MLKQSLKHPYSVAILGAAVAILGLGITLRPRRQVPRTLSESGLTKLVLPSPERSLHDLSKYFGDAATSVGSRLIYLKSAPHTSVIWDTLHAVTAKPQSASSFVAPIGAGGADIRLRAAPVPLGAPLVILLVPTRPGEPSPELTATPLIPPGDWVIAVARTAADQTAFAYGVYQGAGSARCGNFEYQRVDSNAVLSPALLGGGLFTIQGQLLGVIFDCDGEPEVMSTDSVASLIREPVPLADRIQEAYGFRLSEPASGTSEARVALVWNGSLASEAHLRPGDLLRSVDEKPVASSADLEAFATDDAVSAHTFEIVRDKRPIRIVLTARDEKETPGEIAVSGTGLTLATEDSGAGVAVRALKPGSVWAAAGLQPGDRILRIAGRPAEPAAQVAELLAAKRTAALLLTIRRGNAQAEVSIPHE